MQQFNKPNLDSLQDYMTNNQQSSTGDVNWWNIPNGMSSIRVLPPWDPTGRIALGVFSHRIEYQDPESNYRKYSWTCVNRTFGKRCNICEGLERIKASGVSIDEYLPDTCTYYINALVIYDPAYDNAVKMGRDPKGTQAPYSHVLMRIPKSVYTWIVSQITSPLVGDITDPQTGINLVINKEGAGLSTRYSTTLSPDGRTPIPPEVLNTLELYNLDEIFSSGFEDARVERMVASLNKSANYMHGGVPQVQQGVGGIPNYGYQQPSVPQPSAPQYNPQIPQAPVGTPPIPTIPSPQYTPVQNTTTVPQPQYGAPTQRPAQPTMPQAPVSTQPVPNQTQVPKCFGQYNPADVNCVVCGFEIDCSQKGRS